MTDTQTLVIGLGLIVNVVAVGWNIIKTSRLQESNVKLQSKVNRLSVHLSQEIARLNRINELTRGMYLSCARLSYKYGFIFKFRNENSSGREVEDISIDELSNVLITLEGSTIEMRAIATTISDAELLDLINKLRNSVPSFDNEKSRDEWFDSLKEFEKHATTLLEKVYKLLKAATASHDSDMQKADAKKRNRRFPCFGRS